MLVTFVISVSDEYSAELFRRILVRKRIRYNTAVFHELSSRLGLLGLFSSIPPLLVSVFGVFPLFSTLLLCTHHVWKPLGPIRGFFLRDFSAGNDGNDAISLDIAMVAKKFRDFPPIK